MRSMTALSFAVLLAAQSPLGAQTPPSQPTPEAQHSYIVVLKPGKGADPDVKAFGGSVQQSQFGRMFVTLPDKAVDALRKHQRVKYVQRTVLPGEIAASAPPPAAAFGDRLATASAAQRFIPRPSGNGSWSTGTYKYDGAGNVTAIGTTTETLNSDGKANTYVYDVLGRLIQATANFAGGNVSQTFAYDPYGNVTEVDTTDPSGTYYKPIAVAPASNRLSSAQSAYDAAGNLTADGTNSARFDSLNMMTWKSASGTQDYYIYNAADERVGVQSGNAFWTWSFRDEGGHILRQYQSMATWAGSDWLWLEDYAYRDGHLLAAERMPEEGGRRDFHLDHLGTPRLETGTNGGLIARHDYLPFGQEITSVRQELDAGYDRIDPPHFTGHERDFTTVQSYSSDSTDYMHARYYDTMEMRFFSVDPVLGRPTQPQSWNRYTYVLDNPVTLMDPTGTVENGKPCNTSGIGTPCFHARELTEGDLTKIATQVVKNAPKGASPLEIANRLINAAGDFQASGKAIMGALKNAGVVLPKKGMDTLSNVKSLTVQTKGNVKYVTFVMKAEFVMKDLPSPVPDISVAKTVRAEVVSTKTTIEVSNVSGISTVLGPITGIGAHLIPNFKGHPAISATEHGHGFGFIPWKWTEIFPLP